jgi:hypothetical protein
MCIQWDRTNSGLSVCVLGFDPIRRCIGVVVGQNTKQTIRTPKASNTRRDSTEIKQQQQNHTKQLKHNRDLILN